MTTIKQTVMRRVRTVHALRPFVSTSALCVLLACVSVYAVSRAVWVEMVFRNMPSPADVGAFFAFFASAFLHTDLMVQAFSVLAFASAVWFVIDAIRTLANTSTVRA